MSVPEMGLSEDGKTIWYRHEGVFWKVTPALFVRNGVPSVCWEVYDEDTFHIGNGDTIPEAIADAEKE